MPSGCHVPFTPPGFPQMLSSWLYSSSAGRGGLLGREQAAPLGSAGVLWRYLSLHSQGTQICWGATPTLFHTSSRSPAQTSIPLCSSQRGRTSFSAAFPFIHSHLLQPTSSPFFSAHRRSTRVKYPSPVPSPFPSPAYSFSSHQACLCLIFSFSSCTGQPLANQRHPLLYPPPVSSAAPWPLCMKNAC